MNAPLVEARDLCAAYEGADGRAAPVLDCVTFSLEPGAALGVVGESGSGKTTLGRALLGHFRGAGRFTGGSLRVAGVDVTDPAAVAQAGLRGRIAAMAPQNPLASLTHHVPVGEQIAEVLRHRAGLDRRDAAARALALMAETGLPDPASLALRYPHQLSGGQRQRVVIAAALACDPALLVLDEPTSALDKATELQVLDLVRRLRTARGAGLVLISHDLGVVARVCDRVLVMRGGRVVEEGPASRLFTAPRAAYTRSLIEATRPDGAPRPAPPLASPLLVAEGLRHAYPAPGLLRRRHGPAVIEDVSLVLARGETLGVIGGSGSGKSTLAAILAGLTVPTAGRLVFDGRPLPADAARRSREVRRRIQIVFQDPLSSLNPRRRCGAEVMRPMRVLRGLSRRAAEAEARALFDRLGLPQLLFERFPRQISGGQQQRVALARAFGVKPDVLLCDEITSALDAAVQGQVLDLLDGLTREAGCAVLLITHDIGVLRRMAPRVIVMEGGRVAETCATAALVAAPQSDAARRLLASADWAGAASGRMHGRSLAG